MKVPLTLFLVTLLNFPLTVHGETLQEIVLTNGTILQAVVISMNEGMYRLHSDTLGEIELPAHQIKEIRSLTVPPHAAQVSTERESSWPSPVDEQPVAAADPAAEELQQALMQDPVAMEKILSLQDDPLVQSILQDEETMRAIEAGDVGVLLDDPKIRALIQHPLVQELTRTHRR